MANLETQDPSSQPAAPIDPLPARVDSASSAASAAAASSLGVGGVAALWCSLVIGAVICGGATALAAWVVALEAVGRVGAAWCASRDPTQYTFDWGFQIAIWMGGIGLLVAVGGELGDRKSFPRWPSVVGSAWLTWFLLAGVGGTWLRRRQEIDLGMVEASGYLLMVQTAAVAVPLYVFWQAQRVCRWLWRQARQRAMLAGVAIGASLVASGGVALVAQDSASATTSADQETTAASAFLRLAAIVEGQPALTPAEVARRWLDVVPSRTAPRELPGPSTLGGPLLPRADATVGPLAENRLANCVEALAKPKDSGSLSAGVRYLLSQQLGSGDAEDLAWETVLRVCMRHASNPISDLRSYYFKALSNGKISHHRSPRSRWCLGEVPILLYYDTELGLADLEREVEAAFCALPPTERKVIELRIDGADDATIAAQLSSSSAAVRQAASRGFRKLRTALGLTP